MKEKDDLSVVILKSIAKFVLGVTGTVFAGWALSLSWAWIAVTFLGAPPIGVLAGIALVMVRSMVFTDLSLARIATIADKQMKKDDPMLHAVFEWVGSWCVGVAILGVGALWHFCMFPLLIALGVS